MSFKKGDRGWFHTDRSGIGNVTTKERFEWYGHQKLEEAKTGFFHPAWREHGPADTLISEVWSLELGANMVLLFSATILWLFFIAAQRNEDIGPIEAGHLPKRPSKLPYQSEKVQAWHWKDGHPYIFFSWIK